MNLESFERVIRSCCRHLGREQVTVIGSQALFGSFDDLPPAGAMSFEVAIVLAEEAARDDVAALFGELSRFHETFGVYADPVEVSPGRFPPNWETHDLCVAKIVAGRPKDRDFVEALIAGDRVDRALLRELAATVLTDQQRVAAEQRLEAWSR